MNIFKAFAQIGPLTDNTKGVVAPVGELAPLSATFAREKTQHVHSEFPGETLIGFSYKVGATAQQVTDAIAYQALKAVNWVYTAAKAGTLNNQKDSFQQAFIGALGTSYDLIDSGNMIAFGNYFAPEWILIAPFQGSSKDNWKIWFADASFQNQYDEFEIDPVPPLLPLDQFFDDYDAVKKLVASQDRSDVFTRIAQTRGPNPETVLRNDVFTWTDKNDKTLKVDTDWASVIYSAAGDNLDAVKEAIRTYILANSTHTRDDWAVFFPDLFTSTEFIVTPLWQNIGVPNKERQTGVYSGIAPGPESLALAKKTAKGPGYNATHVNKVWAVVPSQFRSLMTVVVGGPENRDGINTLTQRYPDYLNVPLTHLDALRMSKETLGFVMMLAEMLMYAETMTPDTGVPAGYNRLVRDGVVYIAKTYNKFLYLVVTQYSVKALV